MACLLLVNELRRLACAFQGGDINENTLLEKSSAVIGELNQSVAATEQFDIVLPVLGPGRFSPCFWRWFNWWEDHFGQLTVTEIAQFESSSGKQTSGLRQRQTKAHWLNWRDTPAFTLKM